MRTSQAIRSAEGIERKPEKSSELGLIEDGSSAYTLKVGSQRLKRAVCAYCMSWIICAIDEVEDDLIHHRKLQARERAYSNCSTLPLLVPLLEPGFFFFSSEDDKQNGK